MRRVSLLVLLVGVVLSARSAAAEPPTLDGKDAAAWAALFRDERSAREARDRLVQAGEKGVPFVAALLGSERPIVRAWVVGAVPALGEAGKALRPDVLRLSADPDADVRESAMHAVEALADAFGTDALEPARRVLRDPVGYAAQGAAARVLRRLGERAAPAIADLVGALAHEEPYAADDCARALLAIGPPGAEELARAWEGLAEEARKHVGRGVAEAAASAGGVLVGLLDAAGPSLAPGAEAIAVASGWRLLPALRAPLPVGAAAEVAARRERVRAAVLAAAPAAYLHPSADDRLVLASPLPLDAATFAAVWESGGGHGGTLRLARTKQTDAGLVVREMAYASPHLGHADEPEGVEVVEIGPVPAGRLAACGEVLSVVLAARLVERERLPGEHPAFRISSADWHSRVRIESAGSTAFEDAFTGYGGTLSHRAACRVDAARAIFDELLDDLPRTPRAADAEDRAFLLERCERIATDTWWVRGRLLATVGFVGDRSFEPMLRRFLASPAGEHPWDHRDAINAYVRITGVDLRTTPFESPADILRVRARYLERFHAADPPERPK